MANLILFEEFLYFFAFRGTAMSFNLLIVETPNNVGGN